MLDGPASERESKEELRRDGSFDGATGQIYWRSWEPPGRVRALAVVVHGYAEHGERYASLADALALQGIATYAADHIGHGRSAGERALIADFGHVVDDLLALSRIAIGDHPGCPVIVIGHSMGGLLAARLVQRRSPPIAGVAFLGAVLGEWRWAADALAADHLPTDTSDPAGMSRDPDAARAYATDPLVYHGPYKRRLLEAELVALAASTSQLDRIDVPVAVLHGSADPFVPAGPTLAAAESMPAPWRRIHVYPEARHELLHETNRDEVIADLVAFCNDAIDDATDGRAARHEIFVNPARRGAAREGTSRTEVREPRGLSPLDLHRRLPGYEPTPLVDVPTIASAAGVARVWVKDESSRLGLPAFKMLGASWAVYRALSERLGWSAEAWRTVDDLRGARLPSGFRLVAATDGNHGRAVARMAQLLGLDATILVPAGTAASRRDAIRGEGATVIEVDGTYDDAVVRSAAMGAEDPTGTLVISDTSWPGYDRVPRWVIEGYTTIFDEADAQGADPTVVLVQMGVGALAAATVAHFAGRGVRILVVEPWNAACGLRSAQAGHPAFVPGPHPSIMAGLNCGAVSDVAWPILEVGVDAFVTVDDGDAAQAMRDLADVGIAAGETGAAGLAGLRVLTSQSDVPMLRPEDRVLVLCTEGPTDPGAYERIVGSSPDIAE